MSDADIFAVIVSGGKQHKVVAGEILKLEKLEGEVGDAIEFSQVLMVGNGNDIQVGAPYLDGFKVEAEVLEQARAKKIKIMKFRRRKHHQKETGHRQYYTAVKITAISAA